jgi:glycosyltransferase involved in cell wall biosynthesis
MSTSPPAPLKIALVVPGFATDAADWCIPALTNLARGLAARPGVDLHIYALRYPHRQATYRLRGATIHAFGGAPLAGRRVWGASLGLLWTTFLAALRREHRRAPFALLHGFWATESGYLAAVAGRMLGIPALVHLAGGELVHDPATGYGNQAPGLARFLVAGSLRLATAITVPSGTQRALLHRRYPAHAGKAVDWALGVDTAMFAPATPPVPAPAAGAPLRLVHAASLLPVKHQALLLDGLAAARTLAPDRPVALTVVGQGPLERSLRAQAARLGLGDSVTFAGNQDHAALPALYRAHDAFVLTSRHEAQCMAVLEAAACGLPWIGPPVGALADLAAAIPTNGWSVPPDDALALGQAILAAGYPTGRIQRGAAARAAVERDYALDRQIDRLLDLYAGALGRGARPRSHP